MAEPVEEPEYLRLNRAWWDERAPIHAAGDFYDLDGSVVARRTPEGRSTLTSRPAGR